LSADHERHTGEELAADEIARRAALGDGPAGNTLTRYENRLARSLASVINILDPHVIVLGGGLSNIAQLYTDVPKLLSEWVFSDIVRTRLVPNTYGDSSGVRGAALLWENNG
jgi:predicted NBD/HSP70 family sugar kinase